MSNYRLKNESTPIVLAESFNGDYVDWIDPFTGEYKNAWGELVSRDYRDRAYLKRQSPLSDTFVEADYWDDGEKYLVLYEETDENFRPLYYVVYPE